MTGEVEPHGTWVPDVWHLTGCHSPSSISKDGEHTPMQSPSRNWVRTPELASLLAVGSNPCLCLMSDSHHFCPLCAVKEVFFSLKVSKLLLFILTELMI